LKQTRRNFFDVFDSIIKANGGSHLVGGKLSYADLWLASAIDQFQLAFGVNIAEGRENVLKMYEVVTNTPKIKEWRSTRPKTPY